MVSSGFSIIIPCLVYLIWPGLHFLCDPTGANGLHNLSCLHVSSSDLAVCLVDGPNTFSRLHMQAKLYHKFPKFQNQRVIVDKRP